MNLRSSAHAHRFIYIIYKWASGSNIVSPVFSNVTVSNTFTDVVSPDGSFIFQGTYSTHAYTAENKSETNAEQFLLLGIMAEISAVIPSHMYK